MLNCFPNLALKPQRNIISAFLGVISKCCIKRYDVFFLCHNSNKVDVNRMDKNSRSYHIPFLDLISQVCILHLVIKILSRLFGCLVISQSIWHMYLFCYHVLLLGYFCSFFLIYTSFSFLSFSLFGLRN